MDVKYKGPGKIYIYYTCNIIYINQCIFVYAVYRIKL